MIPAIPVWAIKLGVAAIVLSAVGVFAYVQGRDAGAADSLDKLQAHLAADAVLAIAASEDARKAEQAHALALSAIAKDYEENKENAQRDHARLVADLRRGTVRLQDHWTCPAAVPATGPGTGLADEVARLREQGAADLIAAADRCDAQVKGLQAATVKDRQ